MRLFVANRARVVQVAEMFLTPSCKGRSGTACSQKQDDGSWLVYVVAGRNSLENAVRVTHEATHFFGKGDDAEEDLAWKRALRVYRRLDAVAPKNASRGDYADIDEGCKSGAIKSHICP